MPLVLSVSCSTGRRSFPNAKRVGHRKVRVVGQEIFEPITPHDTFYRFRIGNFDYRTVSVADGISHHTPIDTLEKLICYHTIPPSGISHMYRLSTNTG